MNIMIVGEIYCTLSLKTPIWLPFLLQNVDAVMFVAGVANVALVNLYIQSSCTIENYNA